MVEVKTRKRKEKLPILITEKEKTQILLGLDWLDKLEIGHQTKKTSTLSGITLRRKDVREI